ncbi:MAG: TRAP transporter TatT component family protein [Bacteriovoracaceae bacterium]|nr:TRAP transporter TatT component family protein [Bacteriovoracaceae bacterium]
MRLHFLFFLIFISACASDPRQDIVIDQTPIELSKKESITIRSKARATWLQRNNKEKLLESISLWEKLSRTSAADKEVFSTLAHGYFHLADAYEDDIEIKKTLWEKGLDFGDHALSLNPKFANALAHDLKYADALQELEIDDIDSIYWTLANLGKWVHYSGLMTKFKYEKRIKNLLKTVERLDKNYFYGAVPRYWGAFYAGAPRFFGRDLKKSEESFLESIKIAPQYLGTKVLMAEVLFIRTKDKKRFKQVLEEVVATSDKIDKKLVVENQMEKAKAQKLLARISDLF